VFQRMGLNTASVCFTFMGCFITMSLSYCSAWGRNPQIIGPPVLEQMSLTSVRVSWQGLLEQPECADKIVVKHFKGSERLNYKISEKMPVSVNSYIVRHLTPHTTYTYQVIAVEDKGKWGVPRIDYNRGPKASFTTTLKNRRDGLEVTVDDLIVGFRRKGSSQDENSTDARNLYVPFYPSWQQPRNKQRGVRVEFLVVVAVVALVLTIVAVSTVYNWSRKRCCKAKSRDFNFSMSMYDDDSDAGVVLRQSLESEDDDKEVVSTLLTPKTSLPDYTSAVQPDDGAEERRSGVVSLLEDVLSVGEEDQIRRKTLL